MKLSKVDHPGKVPASLDPTVSIRVPMQMRKMGKFFVLKGSTVRELGRTFSRKWLGAPQHMVSEASKES